MLRRFHRWPGLIAAVLLVVLALSGAALSVFPAAESVASPGQTDARLSVADLAGRVQAAYPNVEQIRRAPSGRITAYWFEGLSPSAAVIDPSTGQGIGTADSSAGQRWLTDFHRSLFLGDGGRIVMAFGAGAMLLLACTGLFLVSRRTGGWRRFFAPLKGPLSARIHVEIARVAVLGFAISSATALWMTAGTFGLVPEGAAAPRFPTEVSDKAGFPPAQMDVLRITPVDGLRELTFPASGDTSDVFTLQTDAGTGYIDQGTGALLSWQALDAWGRANEIVYMLHTGQGAPLLGLVLGLMALGIPAMAATGMIVWATGRRGRPRIRANAAASQAETVLLVGSEGGSTWGFAATLHAALTAAGQRVHSAPMSSFSPRRYTHGKRILVLAATYGEGDAPATAKGFIGRLAALSDAPPSPLAVLGFGDRSFPDYCGYAERVARLAEEKGWTTLLPMATVDRQSAQDFTRWGRDLGAALGIELELNHQPVPPRTAALTLVERRDYGAEMQRPSAILRFALPRVTFWQRLAGRGLGGFSAGDLLGVVPEGSEVPRLYSLASSRRDGFVEVCVSKHPGGLCSGQLLALRPGDQVRAFVRRNPSFRPARGKAPLLLIGAGTGIGPLAGFIRANRSRRPMHLYFGTRHPKSDMLYDRELPGWQEEGRLASLATAFSRTLERAHVQDALRRDAAQVTRAIAEGAQIMVCGGREMAAGVAEAIADILAPMGLSPAMLKAEGRYVEDVY
jgi:sulfite reductase (NADPH) flavoprotein alpha-component